MKKPSRRSKSKRARPRPEPAPRGGDPLRKCICKIEVDQKFPILVAEEGRKPDATPFTRFRPRFTTQPICVPPQGAPRDACTIQRLNFAWTLDPIEPGPAGLALSDETVEKCTVTGRGLFKLCVKVTLTCAAFAGTNTLRTTTCDSSGCDEFQIL